MHSGLYIDSHLPLISRQLVKGLIAIESLGISIICWNTAAYTTYIIQNYFQNKPNGLGFKGWCITVLVPEIVEFNTK